MTGINFIYRNMMLNIVRLKSIARLSGKDY